MNPDALISEARAKIIWGESSLSVRGFLISNGISEIDADAIVNQVNAQRNAELRRIGMKKTIIGAILTIGACFFFYWSLRHIDIQKMNTRRAKGFVMVAFVVAIGGFYGCWKLMDGITYLVRPESEHKTIPDIIE
jgi:hypothetical protein